MKPSIRYRWMLWAFGKHKVPLIGHVKPKLLALTDDSITVMVPLLKRNKNHLNSMYFGSLAIGADIAAGFHGLYHAQKSGQKVSLAFKSMSGQFSRRPEDNVYFVSDMGQCVKEMLLESQRTKKRVNQLIRVNAFTHFEDNAEEVANFTLELSLKVI